MSTKIFDSLAVAAVATGRRARRAGWVVTWLVTLFLGFDALTHIVRESHVVAANEELGAPTWFPVVCGIVLAACLVAYHVRRTAALGAVLIVGYLGGACAVNLATGQPLVNCFYAIVTAVLVWAGLWSRDARLRAILAAPAQ
jgi:hypothetical protein